MIGSKEGREGSVVIHQDIDLFASRLSEGKDLQYKIRPNSGFWLQVVEGEMEINGSKLKAGDAAYGEDEAGLSLKVDQESEFLLFDIGKDRVASGKV